jgi:hypothetical protein
VPVRADHQPEAVEGDRQSDAAQRPVAGHGRQRSPTDDGQRRGAPRGDRDPPFARGLVRRPLAAKVGARERVVQHFDRVLPAPPHPARVGSVPLQMPAAPLPGSGIELRRDAPDVQLQAEEHGGLTRARKRSGGGTRARIEPRAHAHVVAPVAAAGREQGALQQVGRKDGPRPDVKVELHVHRRESALLGEPRAVAGYAGRALGRVRKALPLRVHQAHGTGSDLGEQRGVAGHQVGVIDAAAHSAVTREDPHAHAARRDAEQSRDAVAQRKGVLRRAGDDHLAVFAGGEDPERERGGRLLESRTVRAVDDAGRSRKGGLGVAALKGELPEGRGVVLVFVGDAAHSDLLGELHGQVPVGAGDEDDGLSGIGHAAGREKGHGKVAAREAVGPGDRRGVSAEVARRQGGQRDFEDPAPRGRPGGRRVERRAPACLGQVAHRAAL